MKIHKYDNYFVVRIERGEEIIDTLKRTALSAGIKGAFFYGLGVGNELELGYFDARKQDYVRKSFEGEYEFTSLAGNIAIFEGETVIHCHATITDPEFRAFGGHLFKATVPATLEIIILPFAEPLQRRHDSATGLKLLDL